ALSVKHSMHMVLRSSKARGPWSFAFPKNRVRIKNIVEKHAAKNFIEVISLANVGNHLHLHLKLSSRRAYYAFIRAISGAIALTVMKASKLNQIVKAHKDRFWDYRPFTKIVSHFRHFKAMKEYMMVNRLEGYGHDRVSARFIIAQNYDLEMQRKTGKLPHELGAAFRR